MRYKQFCSYPDHHSIQVSQCRKDEEASLLFLSSDYTQRLDPEGKGQPRIEVNVGVRGIELQRERIF